ncbi:DUF308 domain-containing protein [Lacticaseibacillus kribbianus]|uniref:DUF308 domain-containing protein n=1 Tax=Lacticaseibacillus kribbianus TaxID=2926292 RepID=UPI001CD37C8C|nr:DUF308 domain-containing protein [Lacticaseibacillus kribbianus]
MQTIMTNFRRFTALRAVVFVALGAWLVIAPYSAYAAVKGLTVLGLLALAAAAAWDALRAKRRNEATGLAWSRAGAYAVAALLVLALLRPAVSLLPVLFGLMLVLYGINRITSARTRQQYVNVSAVPGVVYGVIVAAAGVFLLFNPFSTVMLMLRVLGVTLIVMAGAECVDSWRAK